MKELYDMLEIKIAASTAYHPQTDGQTKRVNQEIEQYLRIFINYQQDNSSKWLPLAESKYNNFLNSTIEVSSFFANFG